jgi:hypothetical protein
MMDEELKGRVRELEHRERYLTGLFTAVKLALGDTMMPDDEVEAAVLAAMQGKARTTAIAGYLKKMVKPLWGIITMRQADLQRELKEEYPEWEQEV